MVNSWFSYTFGPPFFYVGLTRDKFEYTHCEFHPVMMLGSVSACIPFANHNQAPRNIFS